MRDVTVLPQRLRKKDGQRDSRGSFMTSDRGLILMKQQQQHIWKPAGCHSLHATGVEGAHLLHPFSRPSSQHRSCSSEAHSSCGKENYAGTALRGSRIFKQGRRQDQAQVSHLGILGPLHQAHKQHPPQINHRQGILRLTEPLDCPSLGKADSSSSSQSCNSRPVLGAISSNIVGVDTPCSSSMLAPQPYRVLKAQQENQQFSALSSHGCRRLSCSSNSTSSSYTPGTRCTPTQGCVSPLHNILQTDTQQYWFDSRSMQSPASTYLHCLAQETEWQEQHEQAFSGSNRYISPLARTSQLQPKQVVQAAQAALCQAPQIQPAAEPPMSPVQHSQATAVDPQAAFQSPKLGEQLVAALQPCQQQSHLTQGNEDTDEWDDEDVAHCTTPAMRHTRQGAVASALLGFDLQQNGCAHQLSQHSLQKQQHHGIASTLQPVAASAITAGAQQQHTLQQVAYLQDSAAAERLQVQHCGCAQQHVAQHKSAEEPSDVSVNDTLAGNHPQDQECMSASPEAAEQQQQELPELCRLLDHCEGNLEQQQRRQQWRAHQHMQQQQQWLSHIELQQRQQQQNKSHSASNVSKEQQQPQSQTYDADSVCNKQQQTIRELPAAASPAAAAAASAAADYRRIMLQAEVMAQKSEAAWAQLTKYQQQRICGRLPSSSNSSSSNNSTNRFCTPVPLTGTRQMSRLGPHTPPAAAAAAAAAGRRLTPSAVHTAVGAVLCKTPGSALLHMSSPAAYPVALSSSGSSSSRKGHSLSAFLTEAAATAASGRDRSALHERSRLASMPGSPAAACSLSSFSSNSSRVAGRGWAHSAAPGLNFALPSAITAAMQSLCDSNVAAQAAARASIAASLRSSCDMAPGQLPSIPSFSEPVPQPVVVREHLRDVVDSSSGIGPMATSMQQDRFLACSSSPPLSPACSLYLTPTAAEPAAIAAVAADGTGQYRGTLLRASEPGCAGAQVGRLEYTGSKAAWWRTPNSDQQQQQMQQQMQEELLGSVFRAHHLVNNSPATCVKPKDLLNCFDDDDGDVLGAAAAAGATAPEAGCKRATAAAAGRSEVGFDAPGRSSSVCSSSDGFPFTPSGYTSLKSSFRDSMTEQQGLLQLQSGSAGVSSLTAKKPASSSIEQRQEVLAEHDAGNLGWLEKYLQARAAAAVTAEEEEEDSSSCLPDSSGLHPLLASDPGCNVSAEPAAGNEDSGADVITEHQQKETWTVHNNWAATEVDVDSMGTTLAAESEGSAPASVSLWRIADTLLLPSNTDSIGSGGVSSSSNSAISMPAARLAPESREHNLLQPSNPQQQQELELPVQHDISSSSNLSAAGCSSGYYAAVIDPENLSPLIQNLMPAQALTVYAQLADRLKRNMDETAEGLLARLNLGSETAHSSSSCSSEGQDGCFHAASGNSEALASGVGSTAAAVTCKHDVGMVLVSPHNACGRWQPTRLPRE